ncbi:MAG: hypothetical protein WCK08_05035, partial [Betaproteobacteria bacterium]
FLTEDNGLTLGSVSVSVTEVTSAGAAAGTATSDAPQSGITAGGNSDMRLQLLAGDLVSADANQKLKVARLLLQVDAGSAGTSAQVLALDVGTLALRVQPSGAGSAFLSNVGALDVATVLGVAGAQVGGGWVLSSGSAADRLRVQDSVSTGGALRLDSGGSLSVQSDVQAQGGLSLLAAGAMDSAVGADVWSQTGDVYLSAGTAIDLAGDVSSAQGSAWVQAGSELAFDTLNAASGKAVLLAGTGSIMGKASAVDVRAHALLAQAGQGIGSTANPLRVSVSDLSVSAGAGGVSMVHKDEGARVSGVTVTSLQNQTVQSVSANAVPSPVVRSQSGITVTGNGSLVFSADTRMRIDQAVNVAQDISLAADVISVAASTTAGGIVSARAVSDLGVTAVGRVQSGNAATLHLGVSAGSMTLSAGSVVQAGSAGASLSASQNMNLLGQLRAGGSLDAWAGRDLAMSVTTGLSRTEGAVSSVGNVRLEAGSSLTLGLVDASGASVALKAGTSITDGDSDDATTPQVDVKALSLSMQSGTDAGTAGDRIDLAVDTLALQSTAGSAFVNQSKALSVSAFVVPVQRIAPNGSALAHPDNGRVFDGLSLQGNLTMELSSGDLSLGGQGLQASGSVSLQLAGAVLDGDTTIDTVDLTAAALTVNASSLGTSSSRLEISLGSLTAAVGAGGAHLVETDALLVSNLSSAGAVNLATLANGADLKVARLSAAGRAVTLSSQGAVLDGDSGADELDITAGALTVLTASGLGTAANRIETSLDSLTATVGAGGAHLVETDALLVSSLNSMGAVNLETLAAGADLSIASLSAASQTVTLVSRGSVLDGDASGSDNLDITAAVLVVTANGGSLGTSASRLETSLGSLTATVGAGGAHLVETDALLVSSLSSTGAVNLETQAAGSDLSIASLMAVGQTVTLVSQGAVLDGDSGADDLDITAASLSVTASGLGTASSALDTALTRLSGAFGAGGLNLADTDALQVGVLSSGGAVSLATGGDLSVASLNAGAQSVSLNVKGSVLDGDSANTGVKLSAGRLSVVAEGMGSQSSPLKTSVDSLVAQVGAGGLFVKDTDTVELISAGGSGPVSVLAPAGNFSTTEARVLSSPLMLQSKDIEIGAELSGPRIDVVAPTLDGQAQPLPLVLGSLVANVTPDNGVHIDSAEVSRLNFGTIALGSGQAGQAIWFQTDPQNTADRLVFRSPVEVDTLSSTRFSGLIQGTGLQVRGPGHTTTLDHADIMQTDDVVINDRVLVTQSSLIEVVGGTLTLNGGLTVTAGQTLQLLADAISFGPYVAGTPVSITLEAGATLVLGTASLSFTQDVVFDSDGGNLVLRGAPDSSLAAAQRPMQLMAPDAPALAFEPSAQALQSWVSWLAADPDRLSNLAEQPDATHGLLSLTLGDAQALTRVSTASPWTDLTTGSVVMRGSAVHLGSVGEGPWSLGHAQVLRATAGSVYLNVDLLAQDSVTLVSTTGAVTMDGGAKIAANGSVAVSAAQGIVVGQIDSDTRIDLSGPAGQITAAASAPAPHLTAPAVSMYGYGQISANADAQRVLSVQAQALQVSAPSGVALRAMSTDGLIYRVIDHGVSYLQLKLMDSATQRVLVADSQVQSELSRISAGQTPAQAWQATGRQAAGLMAWVPSVAASTTAVSRYLGTPVFTPLMSMRSMSLAPDDLLGDMSYGLSPEQEQPALSLEPGSPLLRSTGQLLTESEWTMLAQ